MLGKVFVTCDNVDLAAKSLPRSFIFFSGYTLKVSIYSGIVSLLIKDIVEFDNLVEFSNIGCRIQQRCQSLSFT